MNTTEAPEMAFEQTRLQARLRLLQMHYDSGVGHIGGNLSCLDLLLTLHHQVLGAQDQFLLSKGHAAGALYVTLWTKGRLSEGDLQNFHKEGTHLSGHPSPNWIPEIPFATGSLGHGLSLASGLALARRLQGQPGRVYCLLSDGEWQEGSTWEALIFAHHRNLPLTMIVDENGFQGFGSTQDVAGMGPLAELIRSHHVPVQDIDGHEPAEIAQACRAAGEGLHAIVARTRKGNGVSFMENTMEWHYLPFTEELYGRAKQEALNP